STFSLSRARRRAFRTPSITCPFITWIRYSSFLGIYLVYRGAHGTCPLASTISIPLPEFPLRTCLTTTTCPRSLQDCATARFVVHSGVSSPGTVLAFLNQRSLFEATTVFVSMLIT